MSETIYQNKPYTYLIKFIPTDQVYYGVRWGNKVSPEDDLWKKYFTSSKYVKELIDEYGSEWFEYEVRQVFESVDKARDWEERVLKRMKVTESNQWLNRTDNCVIVLNEDARNKIRKTNLERYGVENVFQSKEMIDRIQKTNLERYGVFNYVQSEEYKKKIKKISTEKYGCEHFSQSKEVKNKRHETNLERYGVEHVLQNEDVQQKVKDTMIKKYGSYNFMKTDEGKKKSKESCIKKYGVSNYGATEEHRASLMKRYRCFECDYISNISHIGRHQKKTGHEGKILLDVEK